MARNPCSDADARFETEEAASVPNYSKVGTVSLTSTALPAPCPAPVYIGQRKPDNRYRIFLTASGFNTNVKLGGTVEPDPQTGQLTINFKNLPQSPFSDFNLHFFGSERGLLATPDPVRNICGRIAPSPLGTARLARTDLDPVLQPRLRSRAERPCPGATRPFSSALRRWGRRTPRLDRTAPSHSISPEPTAIRISAALTRHDAARLRRDACRGPLLL